MVRTTVHFHFGAVQNCAILQFSILKNSPVVAKNRLRYSRERTFQSLGNLQPAPETPRPPTSRRGPKKSRRTLGAVFERASFFTGGARSVFDETQPQSALALPKCVLALRTAGRAWAPTTFSCPSEGPASGLSPPPSISSRVLSSSSRTTCAWVYRYFSYR